MTAPTDRAPRRGLLHRSRWAIVALAFVAVTLAQVAVSQPASAAPIAPTLTGTSFTHLYDGDGDGQLDPVTADRPLTRNDGFMLGVDFTLEAPLAVGDTFTVNLPDELRGAVYPSFPLTTADGTTIGTCSISADAFSCELTDPIVEQWESTEPFNLYFRANAVQATTETTLPFVVEGGGTFELPGPPGGIGVGTGTQQPTEPRKSGWVDTTRPGQIEWILWLPASDADSISFTDTLGAGEGQDLVEDSVRVWRTNEWNAQAPWSNATQYATSEYDLTMAADLQSFTIDFPTYPDAVAYWVQYRSTVPADVTFGDQFTNHIEGDQISEDRTVTYNSSAGGTGGGTVGTTTTTEAPTTTTAPIETTTTIDSTSTSAPVETTTTIDSTSTSAPLVTTTTGDTDQTRITRSLSTPGSSTYTGGSGRSTGSLARTGSDLLWLATIGISMVAIGLGLTDLRRRSARR